jgi:hypothetical protein
MLHHNPVSARLNRVVHLITSQVTMEASPPGICLLDLVPVLAEPTCCALLIEWRVADDLGEFVKDEMSLRETRETTNTTSPWGPRVAPAPSRSSTIGESRRRHLGDSRP